MNLLIRALLVFILCTAASGLMAQLSVADHADSLLPIDSPSYFENPILPPGNLRPMMMAQAPGWSIMNSPAQQNFDVFRPHLAFFCRVELKIDAAVGTPFRFRLGSVDYVDYLEGKRPEPIGY